MTDTLGLDCQEPDSHPGDNTWICTFHDDDRLDNGCGIIVTPAGPINRGPEGGPLCAKCYNTKPVIDPKTGKPLPARQLTSDGPSSKALRPPTRGDIVKPGRAPRQRIRRRP